MLAVVSAMLALAAIAPAAGAAGSGGVLVVGDSLAELTSPYLQRYLPGVELTVNAVGGSNSYQIYELFEESYDPSQSVIVFDAGTNDNPAYPQILAGNLQKVAGVVGDRCMVVPTDPRLHGQRRRQHRQEPGRPRIRRLEAGNPDARLGGRRRRPPRADAVRQPPPDPRRSRPAGAADRAGHPRLSGGGRTSATRSAKQETRPRPELATVFRFERRQAELIEAIGIGLLERLAAAMLR